jgi:O-antigen/teichoic acid export membrane protein
MIILACLLIPRFTIIGGAIAFVAARVLYALLSYYFFKMKLNLDETH